MRNKIKIPWPVIACALFVFIFTNLFSRFIFLHIPRVHDEIDYLFQAKIFKSGKLYVPSPCAKESFDFSHMVNNGKWYSQYTPGYPLLLLLGLLIGAPWIINPLLASLSIILFFFIGKEIYDYRTGVLASILGSVSIWFLLMSSTMMSHTSGLFFISLFLLFLFRSIKNPSTANGLLAGLGLGMAFLIRPYNIILISIPFLLYLVFKLFFDFKIRLRNVVALAMTTSVFIIILLIYNQITNGHPLKMGYIVSHGEGHGIGFGRTGYTEIPHNPFLGFSRIGDSLYAINQDLFGWPISSFLGILPLFWISRIEKEKREKDLLLAGGFLTLTAGMFFYWGIQIFIGARIFFEAIPILVLLSAHGITEIPGLLTQKIKRLNLSKLKKIIAGVLIFFVAFAFLYRFPRWIWPKHDEWLYARFDNNFAGVTPNIHNSLNLLQLEQSLIIMKFLYHPIQYLPTGWWGPGFIYNDPYLKGKIIYANDKGGDNNIKLFACFPDRRIFLYLGTLEKGMLFPLKKEGSEIVYGKPIALGSKDKKHIVLINDPKKFYKLYSPQFGIFLDRLYSENRCYEMDNARLIEMGSCFLDKGDYQEAAHYFEAVLQIEKIPVVRFRVLNYLILCYQKMGKNDLAKEIIKKINNPKRPRFYRIIPERGF